MERKKGIAATISLVILVFGFSFYTQAQADSPSCYSANDNFYYLESPREINRYRYRADQHNPRSQGYYNPNFSGMSSYQGTTTGPGPNGGYPGSPRGFYNVNDDESTRPHNQRFNR